MSISGKHRPGVERWALRIAHVEGPAGTILSLRPRVVRVTRAEAHRLLAAGRPELAVVAAWAVHDQTGRAAQAVVRAAVERVLSAGALRMSLVRAMLSLPGRPLHDALKRRLAMLNEDTFPEPPFLRQIRLELERRGWQRGMVDGKAEGKAEALLAVLSARGLAVDDDARARIAGCTHAATLDRWIVRAATADSLREVWD